MQRAFDTSSRFDFFRLLRSYQHLLGSGHHAANGCGFGFGLAAAVTQIGSARNFLSGNRFGRRFRCSQRLGLCVSLGLRCSSFGGSVYDHFFADSRLLACLGGLGLFFGLGRGFFSGFPGTRFLLFAFAAALDQLFFLAADELGLAACVFLTAGEFGVVDQGCGDFLDFFCRNITACIRAIFAADEGALLAHFHLDRTGFARGVGLLDFSGLLLDQRNFLALRRGCAMAALQEIQQAVLIRVGQDIGNRGLGDSGRLQLLKQRVGRFFEFIGKLGYGRTGHLW